MAPADGWGNPHPSPDANLDTNDSKRRVFVMLLSLPLCWQLSLSLFLSSFSCQESFEMPRGDQFFHHSESKQRYYNQTLLLWCLRKRKKKTGKCRHFSSLTAFNAVSSRVNAFFVFNFFRSSREGSILNLDQGWIAVLVSLNNLSFSPALVPCFSVFSLFHAGVKELLFEVNSVQSANKCNFFIP